MSDPPECNSLCERCSVLSFDDRAIGGQGVLGKDGVARLSFPESQIKFRPLNWIRYPEFYRGLPEYRLVRLDWEFNEILPDMPHLSRSSQLGCAFCRALRNSLEETLAEEAKTKAIDDGPLLLVAYVSLNDKGIEGLVIEGTFKHYSSDYLFYILFPIAADSNCCDWLGAQPERDASYLHPTNICKMRQLLDHCTSTCHPDTPSSFMPTRLIDIGHDVAAVPRLVLSSNIGYPQQIKYAALSYCWGSEKDGESQFKTEKASLERRCASLPSQLMTPTTNDAIALARAIGIRYLWIDALCIIQDDKDDWLHEFPQMDLIYRHAFVTFCSLNSDSCHESFLNRAPAVRIPFQSTIRKDIKGSYLIGLQSRTGEYLRRGSYIWDSALSKWDRRCWTFQEKEMSTRLLMFGSLRMHFACAKSDWSEGDEAPINRSYSRPSDMIMRFKDKLIPASELYGYWKWLVDEYGHRSVTFDKDRLPAIAGLARIIGKALQDRYLAGLWKNDLHYGLNWYSSGDMLSRGLKAHILHVRERSYVAPSWSWAACADVKFEGRHDEITIEESVIEDVNTDTISDDPYGQVSGGFLRMRGKTARMPNWLLEDETDWSNNWFHFFTESSKDSIQIVTDWFHKEKEAGLESLVVILLSRIENEDGATAPCLRALLLYPADESGTYYRVGVVWSQGSERYKDMRGWFEESQEETICII